MNEPDNRLLDMYKKERFPRSSEYDMEWVFKNEMGPNVLWITELLCEKMDLKPGMRVLDLGCGTGMSSVSRCGPPTCGSNLLKTTTDSGRQDSTTAFSRFMSRLIRSLSQSSISMRLSAWTVSIILEPMSITWNSIS